MGYLGNAPALAYTSFSKQDFTVSATTNYSLDHPVANANELALFINFVRQEPTASYSASGTTLTLTEATSVGDDMYCVFLGKAVQTVNPPNASVGTSQLADGAVTPSKQSALANPFASQLLHVQDQKAVGTGNAGASVVGTQTRTLNTILTNEITGASLSSNQITLPAGTYYIDAEVPGYLSQRHASHLYNETDGTALVIGNSEYTHNTTSNVVTRSRITGRFTISSQKNVSIKQYFAFANGAGLGISAITEVSIFTNVKIWRTA